MLNIGSFFEKFKNAAMKDMVLRQSVIDAIRKNIYPPDTVMPDPIAPKNIQFGNKIIRIQAGSALKSQIFIKKEAILASIREANPGLNVTDLQ